MKAEAQLPDFPQQLGYVWAWFCELSRTDFSPMQVQAFFALEGCEVKRWELQLLRSLRQAINNVE